MALRMRSDGLLAMAAPMVIWALHFLLVYVLSGLACARGWSGTRGVWDSPAFWAQIGLTVVALAVLVVQLVRSARLLGGAVSPSGGSGQSRGQFVSRARVLLAALAIIAVIFTALPLLFLPTCESP